MRYKMIKQIMLISLSLIYLSSYALDEAGSEVIKPKSQLLIFVSSSMPISLLKNYYLEAAKYGGSVVFKGLPNGSFKELGSIMQELYSESVAAGAYIDDEAFNRFGITGVPALVLYREEDCFTGTSCKITYDKVIGNIGAKSALEMFEDSGDMKLDAKGLLQ